jgi:hypothetical protein
MTRLQERETAVHNTVTVLEENSSEVWSSFRVARRANVEILEDQEDNIIALHDVYKRIGTIHKRQWKFSDNEIKIIDSLTGKVVSGKFYLHIAPEHKPEVKNGTVIINNIQITFQNAGVTEIVRTRLPNGYNQFNENYTIEVLFEECLETYITIMSTM